MIANLVCLLVLEMASGFCVTLPQFIGVRALYGIAMGGVLSSSIKPNLLPTESNVGIQA